MSKAKWLLLIIFLKFTPVYSQWQDSIVTTPYSSFLKDLLSREGNIYVCVGKGKELVKLEHPHFNYRNQNLMKVGKQLYLYLFGTGILYVALPPLATDQILKFKRIDRTYNADYNRGSFYYTFKGGIYNLGGYGFWRSNGINRIFNKEDGEWDVAPLSEEIIPDVNVNWHDTQAEDIYVPFQNFKNAATADEALIKGKIDPQGYKLHLKTGLWEKMGNCSPHYIDILSNGALHMPSDKGLWVVAYDNCYCFDYKHNKVWKMSDPSLVHAMARVYAKQQHQYYYRGKIYFESMKDLKYDSLSIENAKLVEEPSPIFERTNIWYYGIVLLIALIMVTILYYRKRNRNVSNSTIITRQTGITQQSIRSNFTETEIQLIDFLISIKEEKRTASMSEVNYILGLKDKNVGLQKKVRSDIINSINEKYKLICNKDLPLIKNIRNETDKRYFEYLLCNEQLEWLLPQWKA